MVSWWYVGLVVFLLAGPLVLALVLRWVVVPIRMRSRQKMAVRPTYELTRAEQLTPEMQQFIGTAVRQFAAEGFEVAANLHQPDGVTNARGVATVRSIQVLLVNRATNDTAQIYIASAVTHRGMVLGVRSEFADGTRLSTGASGTPSIFPRDAADDAVAASWIKDARVLCEFHRRRLRSKGCSDRPRVGLPPGTELDRVRRDLERESARLVRCGYKRLDPSGTHLLSTWKGAFLTTWRLTEPLKSRRLEARDRRARRAWDEVGMDDWRPPVEPQPAAIPAQAVAAPAAAAKVPPPLPPRPFAGHAPLPPPPPGPPVAPAAAVHPSPSTSGLAYETPLAFGEVRTEWSGPSLVVRVGGLSRGQYLARNWYGLIWPVLLLLFMASSLLSIWSYYVLASRAPAARPLTQQRLPWLLLVLWVVLLVLDLARLVRGLRRSRGATMLIASHDGLTFRNAPSTSAPDGQIPREEIESLNVLTAEAGLFRRTYRLIAHVRGRSRRQVLAAAPDKRAMEYASGAVAQGLGIAGMQLPDPRLAAPSASQAQL
jgi:hypothetical protein